MRLRRRVFGRDGPDDGVATDQRLDLRRQRFVGRGTEVISGRPGRDPQATPALVIGAPHLVEAEPTVGRATEDLAAGCEGRRRRRDGAAITGSSTNARTAVTRALSRSSAVALRISIPRSVRVAKRFERSRERCGVWQLVDGQPARTRRCRPPQRRCSKRCARRSRRPTPTGTSTSSRPQPAWWRRRSPAGRYAARGTRR